MSDAYKQLLGDILTPELQKVQEGMNKALEEGKALKEKELVIYKAKIEAQYSDVQERKQTLEAAEKIRVDIVAPDYYKSLIKDNTEYFELAKTSVDFINEDFAEYVPYFARNLILIGAESGNGKSTIAGNLAFHTIMKGKRVLVLTNEEMDTDCYNRVTALIKGWGYANHKRFTPEQIDTFNDYYEKLGQRLTIVSDNKRHENGTTTTGHTTTLEGFKATLESLFKIQTQYDVIIIDYFQNISSSLEFPNLEEWKVLDKVAQYLDSYRKRYNAPIILLSQLKPGGENPAPFKERIERCKSIYNKCTCAMEVVADPSTSTTIFGIWKSRFSGGIGKKIAVGFDKGKYVRFDKSFHDQKHKEKLASIEKSRETEYLSQLTNVKA